MAQYADAVAGARKGSRLTFVTLAALADTACVIGFAAAGRSQHDEVATFTGLWQTAWPFLFALAFTWAIAVVWRRPFAVVRSGLPVWLGTLGFGMVMRVAFTDGGAPLAFVAVAAATLGLTLVGWRLVVLLVRKARSR